MSFIIRDAVFSDIKKVKEICDYCLGDNYITEDDFKDIIDDNNSYLRVCVENDDIPKAFLYFLIVEYEDAKRLLHVPINENLLDIVKDTKVSVLKTAGTKQDIRDKGCFSALIRDAQDILSKTDAELITAAGLRDPKGNVHISGTFISENYKEIMVIKRPWVEINAPCPHCKKDRCICDAVIYAKENRRNI